MAQETMQVAVIDVQGMSCGHCVQQVEKQLRGLPGVHEARVDLARGEAHVTFDGKTISIARLMEAVNDAGYTAAGFTRGPANQPA